MCTISTLRGDYDSNEQYLRTMMLNKIDGFTEEAIVLAVQNEITEDELNGAELRPFVANIIRKLYIKGYVVKSKGAYYPNRRLVRMSKPSMR